MDSPGLADLTDLTGRWIAGWLRSRPGSGALAVEGGWEVAVAGSEKRHVEMVLVEPEAGLLPPYAAAAAAEPGRWLSVLTREPWDGPVPPGLRTVLDRERMMTRGLAAPPAVDAPRGLDLVVDASDVRCRVTLLDQGQVAARGTVALSGATAVFDRIGTEEGFRRRGHGSRLMRALGDWALERGATEGVLVASVEGQSLYRRLGWSEAACLATFSAPG